LIVAAGAVEQASLLPGWTLPGVITTGACRTLLHSLGRASGRGIVVAGNGPSNLRVASELIQAGAKVLAMVEAAPAPWWRPASAAKLLMAGPERAMAGIRQLAIVRQAGVMMFWEHRLVAVEGERKAERAVIADRHGNRRIFVTDMVCVGEGRMPANELPRLLGCTHHVTDGPLPGLAVEQDDAGATSQPDVFVVGEAAAPAGAEVARAQGVLAAQEVSRRLGRGSLTTRSMQARLRRHMRFQHELGKLFMAPEPGLARATAETIVCRCEGISLEALSRQIASRNIVDVATLKRLTRAGMGRCQARYCGPGLAALVGGVSREADFLAPQMPLRPLPVAAIAVEKPEWRAHARSVLPRKPASSPCRGRVTRRREAEIVIVGGGVVGLCTALFLARGGGDVVVIDQGRSSAMASGGNAGSLHAQLLSFDHDDSDEMAISAAARTLPLQRDAIALWRVLERELDANFEMKVTGGLMVAGTRQDLAFLASKIRVEQQQGVACDLIGAEALRALEPALDSGLLGAAYCPEEGKINPLVATDAIAGAAERVGARIMPMTRLLAIDRRDSGFRLETTNGIWRAGKVVNAAGAFSGAVGQMLGVSIPVFGAPLQMIVTEPVAPLIERLVAHASRHLTLKQTTGGAILIGGGWTAGLDPVHRHPRPLRRSLEGNLWAARHVLPALGSAHVVRSWAAMNIDIDGAPILGEHPAIPGFFNAVTSNGYTLAPIVGRITADLIMHAETDRDVAAFSVTRFHT
jgi:glycine/D-amino acid oxidase-like deaminating enzyme